MNFQKQDYVFYTKYLSIKAQITTIIPMKGAVLHKFIYKLASVRKTKI